jgi:hypothetical protein
MLSCTPLNKTTIVIDDELYKNKVMLCVFKSRNGMVIFENPTKTRQYLCTSTIESKKWDVGDTLIIRYKGKLLSDEDAKTLMACKFHKKLKG